ncbi:MAG: GtrA-like protein [Candidatus Parcubacteria bacterium]|jgi:putative flippase GtrA
MTDQIVKKNIHKTLRYLIAGGLGAGTNFVIYYILVKFFDVWYLAASITSFLLSLIVGFYLQKYFTFKNMTKDGIHKQVIAYFIFSLINLVVNVILMLFFVEVLSVDAILSKVFTLAVLAVWSFFVYKNIIFK